VISQLRSPWSGRGTLAAQRCAWLPSHNRHRRNVTMPNRWTTSHRGKPVTPNVLVPDMRVAVPTVETGIRPTSMSKVAASAHSPAISVIGTHVGRAAATAVPVSACITGRGMR
jgi:hypothetical protein